MIIINKQEDLDKININSIQNIKEITISNINIIPEGKFRGLKKLTKVYFNNVKKIDAAAFMNCNNLKYISLNDNIEIIDDFAFANTQVGIISELYPNTEFGIYNNINKNIQFNNISWSDLDKLSKLKKCQDYFNIGDEKEIIINNKAHVLQIYDFDYDDLSNESNNKANITLGLKECLGFTYYINSPLDNEFQNINNWEKCELRTYLQKNIFSSLSLELQPFIKEVYKTSNINNMDIITKDNLFLLSLQEVGLYSSINTLAHTKKYKIFTDKHSRMKKINNISTSWWLRSSEPETKNHFFCVYTSGIEGTSNSGASRGILFGFCI